jgi:hypothetical protein
MALLQEHKLNKDGGTTVNSLYFALYFVSYSYGSFAVVVRHLFNTAIQRLLGLDSAVGIATGYGLDERGVGVRVPVGSRIFSFPNRPDRL